MKLSHLHEAVSAKQLLITAAKELGLVDPHFYDLDDPDFTEADVNAGVDLFRRYLESEGTFNVKKHLQALKELCTAGYGLPTSTAVPGLEDTTLGRLPHVRELFSAFSVINSHANAVKMSATACFRVFFILRNLNSTAFTRGSSAYDADTLRYRVSIARAAMKQLGLTPLEQE